MYKRLRKRFGVVLFALTALVVGIMAVLLAVLSCNKDAEQFRTDLRDSASEISQTIKTSKRINDVWLFEREANKEEIIFIHENGRPFYYRNNAGNEIRDQLITQAIQKACENGIDIEHNIYDRNDMTAE